MPCLTRLGLLASSAPVKRMATFVVYDALLQGKGWPVVFFGTTDCICRRCHCSTDDWLIDWWFNYPRMQALPMARFYVVLGLLSMLPFPLLFLSRLLYAVYLTPSSLHCLEPCCFCHEFQCVFPVSKILYANQAQAGVFKSSNLQVNWYFPGIQCIKIAYLTSLKPLHRHVWWWQNWLRQNHQV